jgi:hypothetical protein
MKRQHSFKCRIHFIGGHNFTNQQRQHHMNTLHRAEVAHRGAPGATGEAPAGTGRAWPGLGPGRPVCGWGRAGAGGKRASEDEILEKGQGKSWEERERDEERQALREIAGGEGDDEDLEKKIRPAQEEVFSRRKFYEPRIHPYT